MSARAVLLGLPGEVISLKDACDHYTTKVGGQPVFPGEQPPPGAASISCGACGRSLSLVMQAYAPLTKSEHGAEASERVLYVFGCCNPGCGMQPSCWRAFRAQLPPSQNDDDAAPPATSFPAPSAGEADQAQQLSEGRTVTEGARGSAASAMVGGSDWDGLGASDWGLGGGVGGEDESWGVAADAPTTTRANAFDFADLNAALDTAHQLQQQQKKQLCAAAGSSSSGGGGGGAGGGAGGGQAKKEKARAEQGTETAEADAAASAQPSCRLGGDAAACVAAPLLPQFLLIAQPEDRGGGQRGKAGGVRGRGSAAAAAASTSREQEHVAELLRRYEAAQQQEGGQDELDTSAAAAGGGEDDGGSDGDDDDGAAGTAAAAAAALADDSALSWGPEAYEKESIRGVVAGYVKLWKTLQWCPEQCARYAFGMAATAGSDEKGQKQAAQLIWPLSGPPPTPPPCAACGSPRVFELQLVAPLLSALVECAQLVEEDEVAVVADGINAAANWDMCSLAVATCSASCCGLSSPGGTGSPSSLCCAAGGSSRQAAGRSCFWAEESIVLVNEEDCHEP